MFNEPPCHVHICRTGGKAPYILNLASRYRRLVTSMLQMLYPSPNKTAPDTYCRGEWVNPIEILDVLEKGIILFPAKNRLSRQHPNCCADDLATIAPHHFKCH